MLELSEVVLKRGYTIYISKKPGQHKLLGTYQKSFQDGLHPHELPYKELSPLVHLSNIVEKLEQGNILQVHQSGYLINGAIGEKKTEGPYCQTNYLEVAGQQEEYNYHAMLINLDMQLAKLKENKSENVIQYKKLYKGVDRYE